MHSHLRRTILTAGKLVLGVAILAFLVDKGWEAFAQLSERTIEWPMLATALIFTLVTAALSFVRWHLLILALGINVRLIDSLRLARWGSHLILFRPARSAAIFSKRFFWLTANPGDAPRPSPLWWPIA